MATEPLRLLTVVHSDTELRAGHHLEIEPQVTMRVATPKGVIRDIPLTEDAALRLIAETSQALIALRAARERRAARSAGN